MSRRGVGGGGGDSRSAPDGWRVTLAVGPQHCWPPQPPCRCGSGRPCLQLTVKGGRRLKRGAAIRATTVCISRAVHRRGGTPPPGVLEDSRPTPDQLIKTCLVLA